MKKIGLLCLSTGLALVLAAPDAFASDRERDEQMICNLILEDTDVFSGTKEGKQVREFCQSYGVHQGVGDEFFRQKESDWPVQEKRKTDLNEKTISKSNPTEGGIKGSSKRGVKVKE